MNEPNLLKIEFTGRTSDRTAFLCQTRMTVMDFIGERMTLEALIHEMVKNIYDHADGRGILEIHREGELFRFQVKDHGVKAHDFEICFYNSSKSGNGINHGMGLGIIMHLAHDLGMELSVDTSQGFHYSGTYRRKRH